MSSTAAAVANRRLQMVILSSPKYLESVQKIKILASMEDEKFIALSRQFIPYIRYHNPKIRWEWGMSESSETRGEIQVTFMDDSSEKILDNPQFSFHEIAQEILNLDRNKAVDRNKIIV